MGFMLSSLMKQHPKAMHYGTDISRTDCLHNASPFCLSSIWEGIASCSWSFCGAMSGMFMFGDHVGSMFDDLRYPFLAQSVSARDRDRVRGLRI